MFFKVDIKLLKHKMYLQTAFLKTNFIDVLLKLLDSQFAFGSTVKNYTIRIVNS